MSDVLENSMRVLAREFLRVRRAIRSRAIEIARDGDRRYRNYGPLGELLFQVLVSRFTSREAQPPTVIVDHNTDVIRVIERSGRAAEGGIVEIPLRRSVLPDQLIEFVPVLAVS